MSPIDPSILQFDIWDTLDEATMEMAQTSEFWTQAEYEVERLDFMSPSIVDSLQTSENDWQVIETQEEDRKDNIVHHDCMWAGSCLDSIHPSNTFVPSDLMTIPPGQSVLRRDISPPRPDTPPSLDEDEHPCPFEHVVDVVGAARRLLRDSAAVAADHSYTLARQRIDYLGVQTPSDSCESEEEIDVVSLGTSHQPLPGTTQVRVHPYSRSSSSQDSLYSPQGKPRSTAKKRQLPPTSAGVGAAPRRRGRGPGRRGRRSNTDTDSEAESPEIERRSIHNDMERQRRISLKNLFDELKKQIPSIKDKERAPKVVILREAASLCRKLTAEEYERENLKRQQSKLMTKLRKLRMAVCRYRSH